MNEQALDALLDYARAVDENDEPTLRDCFTSDAILESDVPGEGRRRQVGHEEILSLLVGGRRGNPEKRRHLVTNVQQISATEDRAQLRAFQLVIATPDGHTIPRATGTYDAEIARQSDRWRIKRIQVLLDADQRCLRSSSTHLPLNRLMWRPPASCGRYDQEMTPTKPAQARPLRADAEHNRERIVEAAQALFAERGIDVTREEIARRAGVGMATLRRRYPTRADLVAGVFEDKMWLFATGARKALEDPDPWHGFCRYVTSLCALQTTDRGFSDVMTMTFPSATKFEAVRIQAYEDFSQLMKRAQAAGALREDFVAEDLILLVMASAGVVAAAGKAAPRSAPRLIGYLLQAFAAPGNGPLPPPPTPRQIYKAVTRSND